MEHNDGGLEGDFPFSWGDFYVPCELSGVYKPCDTMIGGSNLSVHFRVIHKT